MTALLSATPEMITPTARFPIGPRLDGHTVAGIRDRLAELEASDAPVVVLDLSRMDIIDATGLAMLVAAHTRMQGAGRRLVLTNPRPGVARLLAVTRLSRILHVQRDSRNVPSAA